MRRLLAVAVLCAAATVACWPVQPAEDGSAPADAALESGMDAAAAEAGPDAATEASADASPGEPVDDRRRCGPMCLASETCGDAGFCVPAPDAGPADASDAGATCPAPTMRCGLDCVDTTREVLACGACDRPCPALGAPNLTVQCVAGACSYTCVAPFGDCDGNRANGCELRLGTSTDCGRCGRRCEGGTRCVTSTTNPSGECM